MTTHSGMAPASSILVVDDDPDIGIALTDFLKGEGYDVQVAETGGDAIRKAQEQPCGAVLLDIGLPDVEGTTVLKTLVEQDPKLPVIILTAYTDSEKTIGLLSQGAFAYLTKPYNREELKATLHRAIGIKDLAIKAEQVERALSASEDRFRTVVELAPDAVILADLHGNIISWNKAAQHLFGYPEEQVLGKPFTLIMPARYRESYKQGLEQIRSTGESRVLGKTTELHGLRKDGGQFPVELSLTTWTTETEPFYCGIVRDITERKQAEERLRKAYDELERRVAERTAELSAANALLEQDITQRKQVEEERRALMHHLGERVKELTALHETARLLQTPQLTPSEIVHKVLSLIPPAWQYPGITVARFTFDEIDVATPNYSPTPWTQTADFTTKDGKHGRLAVCYLTEQPEVGEGPFLIEERNLINSLSEMLKTYFERMRIEEALRTANSQSNS